MMDEMMLTVDEIAERLRVNPYTVRRWLREGALHGIKMGDRAGYRVRQSELNRFLNDREANSR